MDNSSKHLQASMLQYQAVSDFEKSNSDKFNEFKERILPFTKIKSLSEAKELAKKILPTANEINRFYVGDAKCIIVNKKDLFRISIDTATEYLCYNFQ